MDCIVYKLKEKVNKSGLIKFGKVVIDVVNASSVSNFIFQTTDSSKLSLFDINGDVVREISSSPSEQTIDFSNIVKAEADKYKIFKLQAKDKGLSVNVDSLKSSNLAYLDITGSSSVGNIESLANCTNLKGLDCMSVAGITGDACKISHLPYLSQDFFNVKIGGEKIEIVDFVNNAISKGKVTGSIKSNVYSDLFTLNGTVAYAGGTFNSFSWDGNKIVFLAGSQGNVSSATKIYCYGFTEAEVDDKKAEEWSGKSVVVC